MAVGLSPLRTNQIKGNQFCELKISVTKKYCGGDCPNWDKSTALSWVAGIARVRKINAGYACPFFPFPSFYTNQVKSAAERVTRCLEHSSRW